MSNPNNQTKDTITDLPALAPAFPVATPDTHPLPSLTAARGNPNGTETEQLIYFESVIGQSLGHEDRLAEAIFQIKIRKLYTVTRLTFGDYVKARWDLSRSRAYQLVKFAKLKERARADGTPPPANERAARNLDATGNPLPPAGNYAKYLDQFKHQLKGQLAKLQPGERRIFISDAQTILNRLAKEFDPHPDAAPGTSTTHSQSADGVTPKAVTLISPSSSSRQISKSSASSSPPAQSPTRVDQRPIPAPSAFTAPTTQLAGPISPASVQGAQFQANAPYNGGVTAMSMAQARAKGLIKNYCCK